MDNIIISGAEENIPQQKNFGGYYMAAYNGSQIVICGNTYLEVENCKRIMEYNDIYLKVRTTDGIIAEIWGSGLRLSDYNTNGIAVRGNISSIELHGKGEE